MAKPAGPRCNLSCSYCYYLKKGFLFAKGPLRMSDTLLELFIAQRFEASPGPNTHFEWHGGEPTLLGIEYFHKIREIQNLYIPEGRTVTNGMQTNGLLLNEEWAKFLSREGFSVGLSLDGPREMHDVFRMAADGSPTHARVEKAFQLLKKHRVFCNVLCVLHSENVSEPDVVYDYFRRLGVSYLQFLPLATQGEPGTLSQAAAGPEAIGAFLCRIFDRWIKEDVGQVVIQNIDEALRPIYGIPHALCIFRETCGDVAVLEHDGSFYPCDHFVRPEQRVGNIRERRLLDLAGDPQMTRFKESKRETLPQSCRECSVLDACNGGCPKDRIVETPACNRSLNYLCPAYKAFFLHSRPALTRLAAHMKADRPLRAFRTYQEYP
ncbi:MAG: anaerobic sulfatase maturase [Desulfocapsaceae bacterium]|nr:anaerobic sulfatase maturase [Desulfocapsaceae bacterium]